MALPLLSPVAAAHNVNQINNSQAKPDHAVVAAVGHMANQTIKKSTSDTITISKRAVQMAKSAEKTENEVAPEYKVTSPGGKGQGR